MDSIRGPRLHLLVTGGSVPSHPGCKSPELPDGLFFFFSPPSAGSVHLTDLLHGGGRRTGHASAEQLQTHPPHLQPRRFHVQRCQTAPNVVLPPAQVGCTRAAASRRFNRRFRLQSLTGTIITFFILKYAAQLSSVGVCSNTVGLTQLR